jgi:exodeoxyribonuclease VIII
MIEAGIYSDLSNENYHSDAAISRSGIKLFCESPYKYWANYLNPARFAKKTTDAMEFGSAFHTMILEPKLFKEQYLVMNEKVFKKDNPEQYEINKELEKEAEKTKKQVLSFADYCKLRDMRDALRADERASRLIEGAVFEHSYFWEDPHAGLMVKARPDILRENAIIDLKTCASADTHTYQKTMYLDGLHIQGAMVREGVKQLTGVDIPTVINICIEKTYPYQIGIKIIGQAALEAGHMKFKQALLDIKACLKENKWESYEPEEVELPAWAV